MKKIIAGLIGANLIIPVNIVAAQEVTSELAPFPGQEIEISLQLSTEDNSIGDLIEKGFGIVETEEDYNKVELQVINTIEEAISNSQIEANFSSDEQLVKISSSEDNAKAMTELFNNLTKYLTVSEEEVKEITIYQFKKEDLVVAFNNKNILFANSKDVLLENIEELDKQINLKFESNQILNLDIELDDNSSNVKVLETSKGEFTLLSEANYPGKNIEEFNSKSHLYNKIPGNNPIVYLEFNNLLDIIELGSDQFEEIGIPNLTEEITQELAKELPETAKALNNQMALLIDRKSDNHLIPSMTIAIDEVSEELAKELNKGISEIVKEEIEFQSEEDPVQISHSVVNPSLEKIEISFDTTELPLENSETLVAELKEGITITYGFLNNAFVISTNSSITSEFGNQNVSVGSTNAIKSINTNNKGSISVSVISFEEIANWINSLALILDDEVPGINDDSSDSFDNLVGFYQVEEILSAMKTWTGVSYGEGSTIKEESKINIPFNLLFQAIETQQEELALFESNSSYYQFEDIDYDNDWFADSVEQGIKEGIISTWDNDNFESITEFKGSEEITRGEFVEMIVKAYDLYYTVADQNGSEIFTDVEEGSKYDRIIGIAYQNGIINGDGGDATTVRPNDTLNRAEAVQILYNVSPILAEKISDSESFVDVNTNDWYHNVVSVAVDAEIVKGVNAEEFAPTIKLSRSQAITMIIRLVNNEIRF